MAVPMDVYRQLFENSPDALVVSDREGRVVLLNPQAESLFGYTRKELLQQPLTLLLPRYQLGEPDRRLVDVPQIGRRRSGSLFPVEISTTAMRNGDRDLLVSAIRDATRDRDAAEALRLSQASLAELQRLEAARGELVERLAKIGSQVPGVIYQYRLRPDGSSCFPYASEGIRQIYRVTPDEVREDASKVFTVLHPDDLAGIVNSITRSARTLEPWQYEYRVRFNDGVVRWLLGNSVPEREADGSVLWHGFITDVTEHKEAEERLRESEVLFRGLVETSPIPMLVITADATGRILLQNRGFTERFGYSSSDVWDLESWWPRAYPDPVYRARIQRDWADAVATLEREGRSAIEPVNARVTCRDGSVREVEVHMGRFGNRALVLFNDLTDRILAQAAVRESEARLRTIFDAMPVLLDAFDDRLRFAAWNKECERVTGYKAEEIVGNPDAMALLYPDPAYREQMAARFREVGSNYLGWATDVRCKDGRVRTIEWSNVSSLHPIPGWRAWAIGIDITERVRLEAQLRQSQKMQAIGQLAGGVAHDFNNLLTVILGCTDLLRAELKDRGGDPGELVASIRGAGERAALLTRQLLLFSRKAVVEPGVINLNELLHGTGQMLRRLIGEDVTLTLTLGEPLARTRADPGQIEQVVVNLALNARDAMPHGGQLTVTTSDVAFDEADCRANPAYRPGRFVQLSVRDTGIGIAPEVRAHLFEPFFTTKGPGKGTGLGLATVYGVVQQCAGFLTVESEPGAGSTFNIFLPAVPDPAEAPPAEGPVGVQHGTETVLLVEDQDEVRRVAKRALERIGYRVLEAGGGAAAIDMVRQHRGAIAVLLTDVVMPEMSGPQLAERLRALYPRLRVVYMSGYNEDAMVGRGVLPGSDRFLQKPFTPQALARTIREVLDAPG